MIYIVNKWKPELDKITSMKAQTLTSIYCGRGSALGNPYTITYKQDRDYVCDQYAKYFNHTVNVLEVPDMVEQVDKIIAAAKEGDVQLVCYCAPKRCHCETIKQHVESKLS